MLDIKSFLGLAAVIMTIAAHIPFIRDVLRGKAHPHTMSWLLWSILNALAYIALVDNNGLEAAWSTGTAAILALVVMLMSVFNGTKNTTKYDLIFLGLSSLVAPFWVVVESDVATLVFIILIDLFAFLPKARASWCHNSKDAFLLHAVNTVRHVLVVAAIASTFFIDFVYAGSLVVANSIVLFIGLWKRSSV